MRLIAPDRPGFGRSAHRAGRRLADWPNDVRELADYLGVDRFEAEGDGHLSLICRRLPEALAMTDRRP